MQTVCVRFKVIPLSGQCMKELRGGGEGGKRFGSVVKRMSGGERGHSPYQKYWKWEKAGIIS